MFLLYNHDFMNIPQLLRLPSISVVLDFFSGFRYLVGCFLKTPLSNYFSGTVLYGKHFWLNNSFSPKSLVVFDHLSKCQICRRIRKNNESH